MEFFSPDFVNREIFTFLLLPLLIFMLRILDVSIGTIRIIFVSRGNKLIAPFLGFFEVLVWVIAIGNIINHLDNWLTYVAYAGGFATGNYIGMVIEERLALGISLIRVITTKDIHDLSKKLNNNGYDTTTIDARGREDDVSVIYIIVKRKNISKTIELIKHYNPTAFYTIEDIRYISHENFPTSTNQRRRRGRLYLFGGWRKGK